MERDSGPSIADLIQLLRDTDPDKIMKRPPYDQEEPDEADPERGDRGQ